MRVEATTKTLSFPVRSILAKANQHGISGLLIHWQILEVKDQQWNYNDVALIVCVKTTLCQSHCQLEGSITKSHSQY